jgi:hypothetical protein
MAKVEEKLQALRAENEAFRVSSVQKGEVEELKKRVAEMSELLTEWVLYS